MLPVNSKLEDTMRITSNLNKEVNRNIFPFIHKSLTRFGKMLGKLGPR